MTDERKDTLSQLATSFIRQGKLQSGIDVFDYLVALYQESVDTLNAYAVTLYE